PAKPTPAAADKQAQPATRPAPAAAWPAAQPVAQPVEQFHIVVWPNVVVNGILGKDKHGSALISGQIVPVGESIQEIKLVSIDTQGVLLEYQNERQFVRVSSSPR
ncbi:MAG: hypothetical protein QME60_08905, partial [Verrucomicrobiota bacterium]|nr:hypothetical protein [Verrucomicrobiota bacterium]